MSDCLNYSQSPNNIYKLSDEQISKYYDLVEKQILGPYRCGYVVHIPLTFEDRYNPNFLRDTIVSYASSYYLKVNTNKNKKINKNKDEKMKEQIKTNLFPNKVVKFSQLSWEINL